MFVTDRCKRLTQITGVDQSTRHEVKNIVVYGSDVTVYREFSRFAICDRIWCFTSK